jgi:PEP-CTERM motif
VTLTVTAVPEPETYALMLGGLSLVGWMARRRRPGRE